MARPSIEARQRAIKKRELAHEVYALRGSVEQQEIKIMQAEVQIEHWREAIVATHERIEAKQAELDAPEQGEEEMSNG